MGKKLLLVAMIFLLLWPAQAMGEEISLTDTERIESFSARIAILPEGGIEVTETVTVASHGENFRVMERLLPRWHQAGLASDYEITGVHKNGTPEEYTLTETANGLSLVIDPDNPLEPGRYVYTIAYKCTRLIQFQEEWEKLTWNATGIWSVPIEKVSVSLEFARAPRPGFAEWSGALGRPGQSDGDWTASLVEKNLLKFESVRPLEPEESMTVQVSWPKGYAAPPPGEGRILFLDTAAVLAHNRQLSVQEDITIFNDGRYDQGFVRDFDLVSGQNGRRVAKLVVNEVLLDGQAAAWRLERISGGQRLTLGGLPQGNSILTISYSIDRRVTMAEDIEQLRWLMPGFPFAEGVDQTRFSLELPAELSRNRLVAAFTNLEGEIGNDVFYYPDRYGKLVFVSTTHLRPGEHLVSSVAWPRELLAPISWQQNLIWLVRDNASAAAAIIILILLILYYVPVWSRLGRRPLGKTEPVSTPPGDLSPAALRYLRRRGYDNRAFTAAVLSLAVKGCLMIVEEEGKYALVSSGVRPESLPADEEALLDSLFANRTAVFPGKQLDVVNAARRVHRHQLSQQIKGIMLKTNRRWVIPAVVLSVLGVTLCGLLLPVSVVSIVGLAGFVLWMGLVALVAVRTADHIPGLVDDRGAGAVMLALGAELIIVFFISYLWGEWVYARFDGLTICSALGVILINAFFSRFMSAPTAQGRTVLEQANGFRTWLIKSGADVFPGGLSRFEQDLPYTVALDVSNRWGRRFGIPRHSFSPRWYQGSRWNTLTAETLAASLSILPKSKQEKM